MSVRQGNNLIAGTPDVTGKADTDLSNLDATGKSTGAELSMPSGSYVDLTPVASGGLLVTAPANGYVFIQGTSTAGISYCVLDTDNYQDISWCTAGATNGLNAFIPVKKGTDVYQYAYNFSTTNVRFIYAEGEI